MSVILNSFFMYFANFINNFDINIIFFSNFIIVIYFETFLAIGMQCFIILKRFLIIVQSNNVLFYCF